jgi:hypothetical protein
MKNMTLSVNSLFFLETSLQDASAKIGFLFLSFALPKNTRFTQVERDRISTMLAANHTYSTIAEVLGRSVSTLGRRGSGTCSDEVQPMIFLT